MLLFILNFYQNSVQFLVKLMQSFCNRTQVKSLYLFNNLQSLFIIIQVRNVSCVQNHVNVLQEGLILQTNIMSPCQ